MLSQTMTAADLLRGTRVLLDSNVLIDLSASDPRRTTLVKQVLSLLGARDVVMCITFQNASEFWNTATRPLQSNGLGLSTAATAELLRDFEVKTTLLVDPQTVYSYGRDLIERYAVRGKQVHDAKLAASMLAHNLDLLLTSNKSDFTRFREIVVIQPEEISL